MRISYKIVTSTIRYVIRCFYNYEIVNAEKLKNFENCIIASNHISANDPPFLSAIIPQEIYYLAKAELFRNKILGSILRYLNCIPIRRGVVDRKALVKVKEVLKNNKSILLFPEGTRSTLKARPGIGKIAIETGTNILPICIKNSNRFKDCFFRKKRLKFVIGDVIDSTPFVEKGENKQNYRDYATFILNKIIELDDVS